MNPLNFSEQIIPNFENLNNFQNADLLNLQCNQIFAVQNIQNILPNYTNIGENSQNNFENKISTDNLLENKKKLTLTVQWVNYMRLKK